MILTEESMELANLVGNWLKNDVAPVCGEYDAKGEFPQKFYDQMVELGLNNMCTPERFGGLDLSAVDRPLLQSNSASTRWVSAPQLASMHLPATL